MQSFNLTEKLTRRVIFTIANNIIVYFGDTAFLATTPLKSIQKTANFYSVFRNKTFLLDYNYS